MNAGPSAICRRGTKCLSGQRASTSRLEWTKIVHACWSPKAKARLRDILMAETKAEANAAIDFFVAAYGVKYDRAVKCLTKDRADLLALYALTAEHWKHIRMTNPIESTFVTVDGIKHESKSAWSGRHQLSGIAPPSLQGSIFNPTTG